MRKALCLLGLLIVVFGVTVAKAKHTENKVFICKEVKGSVMESATYFRHWEKIYAFFMFRYSGREKLVEFKWMNPQGQEEYKHQHLINKTQLDRVTIAYSWLSLDVPSSSRIFGSKFFGVWLVKVFLDGKKVAEEQFTVD